MNTGERCVWGESSVCRHVCYQFISCMGEMCVCEMSVYVCVLGGGGGQCVQACLLSVYKLLFSDLVMFSVTIQCCK